MAIVIRKKVPLNPSPVVPEAAPEQPRKPLIIRKQVDHPAPERRAKKTFSKPLDNLCQAALTCGPGAAVSWWLMASYAYYIHDISLLSDELYDSLAGLLKDRWSEIQHPHKHLITAEHLAAGSLFDLKEQDYPLMTRNAAAHLVYHEWGQSLKVEMSFQ